MLSGLAFVISIPVIALSQGYGFLFFGRLLQGISGGFIGIVVPLYLAECLSPADRGKGTGVFQWLLTFGIMAAAFIGIYYSYRVDAIAKVADAAEILAFKNQAWRRIFWVSLPPGVIFVLGSLFITESPRWLFRKGRIEAAKTALMRSRSEEQASIEMREMDAIAAERQRVSNNEKAGDSLLRHKYVVPFVLACVILFCNTATGINSIIGYNTGILLQSGLSDIAAHWGYVIFTAVNFVMTMIGMSLVDRVGRKPLFIVGTGGIVLSLIGVGVLFMRSESRSVDRANAIQAMVDPVSQRMSFNFTPQMASALIAKEEELPGQAIDSQPVSLTVVYSCGDFTSATNTVRSDDPSSLTISRDDCLPQNKFDAFLKNPFASLMAARSEPIKIKRAQISPVPETRHGWLVASSLYLFMAFFAVGPGVCVWLALTELMPARIRSNGMSIALVINQLVSTAFAAIFLPFVSKYGYSTMFFVFAGFALIYLLITSLFLPETKGKTLEEIEEYFESSHKKVRTSC
jgi:MFS family permease